MRVEGIPRGDRTEVAAVAARLRELAASARLDRPTLSPESGHVSQFDNTESTNGSDLGQFAEALESVTKRLNSNIRLDIDEPTGRVVAKIIDRDTNEVVRQIPPEEMLRIAARLNDLVGLLFDAEG